jgi:hypothetical protein
MAWAAIYGEPIFPNQPVYNGKFGYARHLTMFIGFRVITIWRF